LAWRDYGPNAGNPYCIDRAPCCADRRGDTAASLPPESRATSPAGDELRPSRGTFCPRPARRATACGRRPRSSHRRSRRGD